MIDNAPYFIDEDENGMGRCLVPTAQWSDGLRSVIEKENISVLRLSRSAGWQGEDISFVKTLTGLRGIEIFATNIADLTPLQAIPDLEYLALQSKFTKSPDFSTFRNLKICKLFWNRKLESVFACKELNLLNIVDYPSKDIQVLKNLACLERLQLTSRLLISLAGIENLDSLSVLDLYGCSKLVTLEGVEKCRNLHTLDIENCKNLYDVSPIGKLANLREVNLTDCGKIKSLGSLASCRMLEKLLFVGDTTVEDGDLTPLLDIPMLKTMRFADRRHYSHKSDQIAEILS